MSSHSFPFSFLIMFLRSGYDRWCTNARTVKFMAAAAAATAVTPSRRNYINLCSRTYDTAHIYRAAPTGARGLVAGPHGSSFAPFSPLSGGYISWKSTLSRRESFRARAGRRERRSFYNLIRYGVPCTINYRDKQTPANYTFTRGHFTASYPASYCERRGL